MTTIYLDHNIIDKFDRGETAYLEPVLVNKEYVPIISVVSIEEIFRGGDQVRSAKNIESLRKLGVKYIHSGRDEDHMSIDELDYDGLHQNWLEVQSDIEQLNNTLSFPGTLFNKELLKAMKSSFPFTSKEINNFPEESVFWTCVDKLKTATDANLRRIGYNINNGIENAASIEDQLKIVLIWLNLFGYRPDPLHTIKDAKSFYSDIFHGTYAINCAGILTFDNDFAKRLAAAMNVLRLQTKVSTDAKDLISRIAKKAGS